MQNRIRMTYEKRTRSGVSDINVVFDDGLQLIRSLLVVLYENTVSSVTLTKIRPGDPEQ